MFTPIHSFLGATLLSLACQQYLSIDHAFGCSSILLTPFIDLKSAIRSYHLQTLAGLLVGSYVIQFLSLPHTYPHGSSLPETGLDGSLRPAIAGLLVGIGTKLANGCTSGHFLNGLARCSKRSLVATMTFFSMAVLTVYLLQTAPVSLNATQIDPNDRRNLGQLIISILTLYALSGLVQLTRQKSLISFSAGVNFAAGLVISGMSKPHKTLGFLNLFDLEHFDPSLFMVFLGGVLPNFVMYLSNGTKVAHQVIDSRLILGSMIFGIGWGLYGSCPGPAIVNLVSGTMESVVFVGCTIFGGYLVVTINH